MARGITSANLDGRAILVLLVIFTILVMGFDIDNLFGRE